MAFYGSFLGSVIKVTVVYFYGAASFYGDRKMSGARRSDTPNTKSYVSLGLVNTVFVILR